MTLTAFQLGLLFTGLSVFLFFTSMAVFRGVLWLLKRLWQRFS